MGYETSGYTQMTALANQYDINGNQTSDAQKGTITTYNHLDLPTQISFADGKSITFLYDAAGTLLTKGKHPAVPVPPVLVEAEVTGEQTFQVG